LKTVLQISEVSEKAEEAEEEQLPRVIDGEGHETQEAKEAQKTVNPSRIFSHTVIMPDIFIVRKRYIHLWELKCPAYLV
jgi:hypothetical protein